MATLRTARSWLQAGGAGVVIALAVALGAHFEGLPTNAAGQAVAYYDAAGQVWSICYGDTHDVKPGGVRDVAACRASIQKYMAGAYDAVMRCAPGELTLGQAVAFTDGAYNLGYGIVCNATWPNGGRNSVYAYLQAGDPATACERLLLYVKGGGAVLPGLEQRRVAEVDLCRRGIDPQ